MAYYTKVVAELLTSTKELGAELDRRHDGHATQAITRILTAVHKTRYGAATAVRAKASSTKEELVNVTRYMAQVDFVFSQNPALVAAHRPRDPWNSTSYSTGCMANGACYARSNDVLERPIWLLGTHVATR